MIEENPWWKKLQNEELSYIIFHLLGEITNRDNFDLTEQLKTRMLSVATNSWKEIKYD